MISDLESSVGDFILKKGDVVRSGTDSRFCTQ